MSERAPIRILLAEGHALFRAALQAGLEAEDGIEVVSAVGRDEQAVQEAERVAPDVALIDAALPATGGVKVAAAIKASDLRTAVLIVSEIADPGTLFSAVEAGADGYLDRSGTLSDLVAAIRRVHSGHACIPPELLGALLRRLILRRRDEDLAVERFGRLSRREREVAALLVKGLDNRAIAEALVVSPHTARTHIQSVLEKLEVHSRLEAATFAMEHNLIERFAARG